MSNPIGTVPPKNTGISIGGFPNPANLHGVYSLLGKDLIASSDTYALYCFIINS
jgi:hypothetical protein